jgi:hypothetical protein
MSQDKEVTVQKVSSDQYFLMLGIQVIGMLVNMENGGWLWVLVLPFITGIEAEKEKAAQKVIELFTKYSYGV